MARFTDDDLTFIHDLTDNNTLARQLVFELREARARLAAVRALCDEEDPEMTFPEWQNKIREAAQGETAEHYDTEDAHGNPVCVCPDINGEGDRG